MPRSLLRGKWYAGRGDFLLTGEAIVYCVYDTEPDEGDNIDLQKHSERPSRTSRSNVLHRAP